MEIKGYDNKFKSQYHYMNRDINFRIKFYLINQHLSDCYDDFWQTNIRCLGLLLLILILQYPGLPAFERSHGQSLGRLDCVKPGRMVPEFKFHGSTTSCIQKSTIRVKLIQKGSCRGQNIS